MHPRARRYSFVATIELTDLQSEMRIQGKTVDLSVYGCRVETHRPFLAGTKVRIRITYGSASLSALGRAYARPDGEMGVVFTRVEPKDQVTLEKWVEEQRHAASSKKSVLQ